MRFGKIILYSILIFWSVFFIHYWLAQLRKIKPLWRQYSYAEEQKYQLLDGGYYQFMKLCMARIPEKAHILFDIEPTEPPEFSDEWFIKEYFLQKAPYYLYPRKVYRRQWLNAQKADYTIVYNLKLKQFYIQPKEF